MLEDDNKPNNDRLDNDQSDDDKELEGTRGARRGGCSHKFRKVGAKLVCSKCGLKRSSGRVS